MQHRMIGRLLIAFLAVLFPTFAAARAVSVSTGPEIVAAVNSARPGDVITIAPGRYELPKLDLRASGDAKHRIVLRAAKRGAVELRSAAVEFMKISGADWTIENLDIAGICAEDSQCEHAFHIVGRANGTIIRGNRVRDYNAHIKGNGENGHFPNDALIENNWLFDTRPRVTENPVAPIDVVGGARWEVRGNLIADYGKRLDHPTQRTDDWSYAMFLKGNSERGLIAGNIVGCDIDAPPTPSIRGISLGGSGTGPGLCDKGGDCTTEHRQGTIWGNIVFNCGGEAGLYLFQARDTLVAGNIVVASAGVLASGVQTKAVISQNRLDGAITAQDGATLSGVKDNVILSRGAARQSYVLPLLGKAPAPQSDAALARAAKAVAAYRAYRESLEQDGSRSKP